MGKATVATCESMVPLSAAPSSLPVEPSEYRQARRRLLHAAPDEIAQYDIALANLLMASGLPGANGLNVQALLVQLDQWTQAVAVETERFLSQFRPSPLCSTEAHFRCYMVMKVLRDGFGLKHYLRPDGGEEFTGFVDKLPDGSNGFENARNIFIHGLLGPDRVGTCTSLPVLYAAVGRRLGYPMKLALAVAHVFNIWDEGPGGLVFNMDGSGPKYINCHPNEYYIENSVRPWTEYEKTSGCYLRSLTPAEELALFCANRGWCLRLNGHDEMAGFLLAKAVCLSPDNPEYPKWLSFIEHTLRGRACRERQETRLTGPAPVWDFDEVGGVGLIGPGVPPPHIAEPPPPDGLFSATNTFLQGKE